MIKRKVDIIGVHCTATTQEATVEAIVNYWRNTLGWKSPGYHYIIPPNGKTIPLVESLEEVVNGIRGYNGNGVHFAYIGGKGGVDNRTVEQKKEMERILKNLLSPRFVGPDVIIRGHRDTSPDRDGNGIITSDEFTKLCPSFSVSNWLREINLEKYAY